MPGQGYRPSQQSMQQTEEGYVISAEPMQFESNSDVQQDVSGNVRDRAEGMIIGGYNRLYQNTSEAIRDLESVLSLPDSDTMIPASLIEVTADWVLEQLKGSALEMLNTSLPFGTLVVGMVEIYQGVEAAKQEATSAAEAWSLRQFTGQMTAVISNAQTALYTGAVPWLDTLQGYCHEHPESAQMVYDYLQEWGDQIHDLLMSSVSLSGQLARLAGHWSASQGGHIELRLLGLDMSQREIHLHSPYADQISELLKLRGSDLRHSGLDIRVTWWPEPGFALAQMEGIVPTEGNPYITDSTPHLFSGDDMQRFQSVLNNPTTMIA